MVQTAMSARRGKPTKKGRTKGGGVMRASGGNTLAFHDAIDTIEKEDYSTSRHSVTGIIRDQGKICSSLDDRQMIAYFSGIQAVAYEDDFIVCKGKFTKNIIHAAGIQPPGLTAAPAIGADVARMAVELLGGEGAVGLFEGFDPRRIAPPRAAELSVEERAELIASNPDYGVIVCRCEEISKGEILDALRRGVPCRTVDGVKRRVRPGMGRCQGAFCGPRVLEIISKEKNIPLRQVRKSGYGSELLLSSNKEGKEIKEARAIREGKESEVRNEILEYIELKENIDGKGVRKDGV